jgi:hypothetical protein
MRTSISSAGSWWLGCLLNVGSKGPLVKPWGGKRDLQTGNAQTEVIRIMIVNDSGLGAVIRGGKGRG